MIVLGIETSCDETAAAVFDGKKVLSDIVSSQIDIHNKYGGIVPELAARRHMEMLLPVVHEALQVAGVSINGIEGVAVTQGPGLIGALLVGVSFAKALAYTKKLPMVGVNHIEGHISAILLEEKVTFPYLGLVVSGGHTSLYIVNGIGSYRHLGSTRDDAAGEALDKAGKLLGLGYPAGAVIDRLAEGADPKIIKFPKAMIHESQYDFSFSGLKTFLANLVHKEGKEFAEKNLNAIAAGYLETVVDMLVDKTVKAARENMLNTIVIAGGVAANSRLRQKMREAGAEFGKMVLYPSIPLCTDNASMIAHLGHSYLGMGKRSGLDMNGIPDWPLPEGL
ncbi:MAG: tRNA (adenosine(37)-N6)-threonylcarbamoyltransferase complex transferase subunit TsaD [Deltaproteobacteria bacterium]|nr:tRNA (adenosine(37)-N6)-threonylcarbamoyltransferase complex transferase subunit TsaD [Deltaproteobacteria bacterium]